MLLFVFNVIADVFRALFWVLTHLWFLIFPIVVCLLVQCTFLFRHFRREGFRLRHFDPKLVLFARPCTKCSGGVQILIRRDRDTYASWGPIPKELQMEKYEGGTGIKSRGWWFSSPAANKRKCNCCHGVGHHWIAKDEVKLPPSGMDLHR